MPAKGGGRGHWEYGEEKVMLVVGLVLEHRILETNVL